MIKLFGQDIPMIEASDEDRQNKCTEVINRTLKEFNCVMVPTFLVIGKNITHTIDVVAKPRDTQKLTSPN